MKQNAKDNRGPHSTDVHINVPKHTSSGRSNPAQKIVLVIIGVVMALVIFLVVFSVFNTSENQIKSRITRLATDYYENYFYDDFTSSPEFAKIDDLDTAMEKYTRRGFASISLRQLLLHDPAHTAEDANYLKSRCDENKSFIQIFPEPPYDKTSYHIEYTYSCNF